MGTELEVVPSHGYELTAGEVTAQVQKIQRVMADVMRENEHYGVIPGTGTKPTLLKPGAEKLMLTFRLCPEFSREFIRDGQHLTVISYCTIRHIDSGQAFVTNVAGSCSTRESRYVWRKAARACPTCGAAAIIKGKKEYGGGWVCFKKQGGCGAKFADGDTVIEGQATGRVPNDDLADQENTVLKMADKRALVAATLIATAASDIFTQDLEDIPAEAVVVAAPPLKDDSAAEAEEARPLNKKEREDLNDLRESCAVTVDRALEIMQEVAGVESSAKLTVAQSVLVADAFVTEGAKQAAA